MIKRTSLAVLFAAQIFAMSGVAMAGDQYVDGTGFAVSGYDVVSYFTLPQAPVGTTQAAPVPGKASITADYNGATFAFSSTANRDAFVANPAAYAPQYDGHCAYGVAKGGKVPANPTLWRIVDGKLYLNITKNVVGFWEEDIPGNLTKSGKNWVGLEPAAGSRDVIPNFTPAAPVAD